MSAKRQITALTKQTAVEMVEVQALVQAARDDVAKRVRQLAAKAKVASGVEREKLYNQIRKINAALGDSLDEWAAEMASSVGLSFHEMTVAELKAAGKKIAADVVRFDRSRVETYLRLIHPDNSKQLAAVFTDRMTATQIGQLRQATVEVFRQSAVSNMTANEINKALQQRWNDIAGTVEFDRFKDRSGRTWANADYLSMLVRTTTARVARESAIDTQLGAGFDLARVRNVGDTCPICSAWDGVIISLSGGDKRFPSYQQSISAGMWHPNCDCLHEYVDDAVDQADIEKQAAAKTPDVRSLESATTSEKAAAIEAYKQSFGEPAISAKRAELRAQQKASADAFDAKRAADRAAGTSAAFAQAGKAAEQTYQAAKAAEAAAEARRLALADEGSNGAREFGSTLKRTAARVGGSTGAFATEDESGQKWILKTYSGNTAQVQNEFIANRLYAAAGVRVPDMRLVEFEGTLGIASKMIDQASPIGASGVTAAAKSASIKSGFAVDAWLANWDVAGAAHDNILRVGSSKDLIRVDQGGALLFRAQGKPKGTAFGAAVNELQTLRDPTMNAQSAALFAGVTDDDVAKQIRSLKRTMKMATVDEVITKSGLTGTEAKALRQTVTARLTWLMKWERDYAAAKKAGSAPPRPGIPPGVDLIQRHAELDPAVKKAWAKMTADQRKEIKRYTGSGYQSMNLAAVKGKPSPHLNTALSSVLPRYDGVVGRGCGPIDMYADAWEKWKSGDYAFWSNKGYTSTAVVPEKVWDKPFKIIIKQKGLQPGGYVDPVSTVQGEKEYLLHPGAKYRVAGWGENKSGSQRFLYLEEPDDPSTIPDRQSPPPKLDFDAVVNKWRSEIK